MTEELSIAEINALWERVSSRVVADREPPEPLPSVQHADPLDEMLQIEGEMASRYGRLGRRFGSKRASDLAARLCEGQLALVKRMAAMVFLRSGRRRPLRQADRTGGGLPEQIREYALWELRQAEAYRKSGTGADPSLREILFEAQKRKEENAKLLASILEEIIL